MKLEVKVNFDFGKLANAIPELIKQYTSDYARESAEGSKSIIDSGALQPLGVVAQKMRKNEGFPVAPPLKKTGKLYKSIKQKGDKVQMLAYGLLHNDGHKTHPKSAIPNVDVVARPFIKPVIKTRKKIGANFLKNIRKALRK